MLLIILTMALLYSRAPERHDNVTASRHAAFHETSTLKQKQQNRSQSSFVSIIYLLMRFPPPVKCQNTYK